MASITVHPGTRTALTTTALDALTAGAYVSAGVVNASAIDPLDVVVEVAATPGTVAGNKQLLVFARVSFDGSTFSTGPTSGSVTTDEALDAVDAPPGLTVTPQLAVGSTLPSGVVRFAASQPQGPGPYDVAVRVATAAGRRKTGVVSIAIAT